MQVFARKGYFAARVSEIARKAGVADGTIYLYFRNKEDILVSLFDEVMAEHVEQAREELRGAAGRARHACCAIAEHHLRAAGRQPRPGRRLPGGAAAVHASSWSASPPPGCRTTSRCVGEVIEEGQREGTPARRPAAQARDQGLLRRARRDGHVLDRSGGRTMIWPSWRAPSWTSSCAGAASAARAASRGRPCRGRGARRGGR